MSRFTNWINKRVEQVIQKGFQNTAREYNRQIYDNRGAFSGGRLIFNPENDETFIEQGYQKNVTIYSIVQLIIKHASAVPFNVFEVKDQSTLKAYKQMTSGIITPESMVNSRILKHRTLTHVDGTELEALLERPNPAQSYASWISEVIAFGKLTGDRFIMKIGTSTGKDVGKAKELYVLPSQHMDIVSGGLHMPVQGYTLDFNGRQDEIPVDDVCHIKDFNPDYDGQGSHLYGQSPLKAAFRNLETNNSIIDTGKDMIDNQMTRGMLSVQEGDLDQVQTQKLADSLRADFKANTGGVTITPAKMSWVNFGLSSADMALMDQYNIGIKDLCNAFNVPVVLLNSESASTESNVKEARKALYQNAIIPELVKIRDELNRFLTPAFGKNLFLDFDFTSIPELQVDMEKLSNVLEKSDYITQNEKRIATGRAIDEKNPLMDQYLVSQGKIPLSDLDLSNFE